MSTEGKINPYLDGIDDWIQAVDLLVQRMPAFQAVNLIIEGSIGGNEWCSYWVSRAFPNSLYVGTDISPALPCLNSDRVDDGINLDLYRELVNGQQQLKTDEGESSKVTLRANCLSPGLLHSLKDFSHASVTMLVTYNGLVGLMGQDFVPGERKKSGDITPISSVVGSSLYDIQLHLTFSEHLPSIWSAPVNVVTRWYYQAEQAAEKQGRQAMRIKDGLVILK